MYPCQLLLHFSPELKALPQVLQGCDIKRWPYNQLALVPSVPNPPAGYVRIACGLPLETNPPSCSQLDVHAVTPGVTEEATSFVGGRLTVIQA